MTLKVTILISFLILVTGVLVSGAILYNNNMPPCPYMRIQEKHWDQYTQKELDCKRRLERQKEKRLEKALAKEAKKWPVYTNEKLGVALRYPKHVNNSDMVFFQVGNILFMTTASSSLYIHRNELPTVLRVQAHHLVTA